MEGLGLALDAEGAQKLMDWAAARCASSRAARITDPFGSRSELEINRAALSMIVGKAKCQNILGPPLSRLGSHCSARTAWTRHPLQHSTVVTKAMKEALFAKRLVPTIRVHVMDAGDIFRKHHDEVRGHGQRATWWNI